MDAASGWRRTPGRFRPREHHDVVIVGAGAAGSALAARLSENPERSVLVLEAGPDCATLADFPAEILRAGSLAATVPGHPNNWAFLGALTPELSYYVPRGKIVGGSSALNGAYFVRAVREDFDRWVREGNDQWSFERVLPYYIKLEDDRDFADGDFHGSGGPVPVTRQHGALLSPVTHAFVEACLDMGFAEEHDKNRPGPPGVGLVPLNMINGVRVNAALAYLSPNRGRANLRVRGGAFVRRVVFEGLRAVGVEVEIDGRRELIHGDEIVLCAGAVNSAHLLLLSGIGPPGELRAVGVPVVHESPGVGKDFTDHPDLWVTWEPKRKLPLHPHMAILQAALNYTAEGSRTVGDMELICMIASIRRMLGGGGSGSAVGDLGSILRRPRKTIAAMRGASIRRLFTQLQTQGDLAILCGLQQEESRGELRLESADPHVPPTLDYHYLTELEDRRRMGDAIRLAADLLRSAPFRPLVGRRTSPADEDLASDRALERWMRANMATAVHMSGTCRMGPASDERAVVDQFLRVRGVEGLRVVDTSAMPHVIRRGPNATAMMMAERAVEFFDAKFSPAGRGLASPTGR